MATHRTVVSSRGREAPVIEVQVGDFIRKNEIGKGSFATVYLASHRVSRLSWAFYNCSLLLMAASETEVLRRHQVGHHGKAHGKAEGEFELGDNHFEEAETPPHRRSLRMCRHASVHPPGHGILPNVRSRGLHEG